MEFKTAFELIYNLKLMSFKNFLINDYDKWHGWVFFTIFRTCSFSKTACYKNEKEKSVIGGEKCEYYFNSRVYILVHIICLC